MEIHCEANGTGLAFYSVAGEANRSPPSSAEVKNCGAVPPLHHTQSWRGAWSARGQFYLFFPLLT
jgi:hypothetical protein